jgi:hypothetical protein
VRRLSVAFFLLFYTASVVGLTVKRTEEWAAQRADNFKHVSHHGARIGETHKHAPHQVQTKLYEDSSILCSFVRTVSPPHCETRLYERLVWFVAERNTHTLSPRAPPSLL